MDFVSSSQTNRLLVFWASLPSVESIKVIKQLLKHPNIDVSYDSIKSILDDYGSTLDGILRPYGKINSIEALILSTKIKLTKEQENIQSEKLRLLFKKKLLKKH